MVKPVLVRRWDGFLPSKLRIQSIFANFETLCNSRKTFLEYVEWFSSHRSDALEVKIFWMFIFELFTSSGGVSIWWAQRQTNYMTGSMSNIVSIPMRFACQGVCVMRYCGPMRYALQFPAHRLGGRMELCVIRGYALSEVCVKRGSTVPPAPQSCGW